MMNLYVSFRMDDGTWSHAQCRSERFKIANIWFPSISTGGRRGLSPESSSSISQETQYKDWRCSI